MRQSQYRRIVRAVACATPLLAAACGGQVTDGEPGSETEQGIIGGNSTVVSAAQNASDPWIAVIGFSPSPDFTFANCTATKIREGRNVDTYLTAAHCVPTADVGSPIRYTNNVHFGGNFISTVFRSVFVHPSCLLSADLGLGPHCLQTDSSLYDAAVFTIDKNSSIPSLLANPNIESRTIGVTEQLRMIGYGDQAGSTTLDTPKQTATVTTVAQGGASNATFTRYIRSSAAAGQPRGGSGDSGGPLLTIQGGNRIVGITSFLEQLDGTTNFVRVANLRRWIANPQKLNVIADQEMGFLLNRTSRQCLQPGIGGPGALSDCFGANQPTDPQYWRLVLMTPPGSGSGFFQIQNTQSGQCLVPSTNPSPPVGARLAACDAADLSQQWAFKFPGPQPFARVTNRNSGQCLSGNGFTGSVVAACNSASTDQHWLFFP